MDVDHVLTLHHSPLSVWMVVTHEAWMETPDQPVPRETATQEQVEGQDRNPIITTAGTLSPHAGSRAALLHMSTDPLCGSAD